MEKFSLEKAVKRTFIYEVSPFSVEELIEHVIRDKEILVSTCYLMGVPVSDKMFGHLSSSNLVKFFGEIDNMTIDKAAGIIDNGIAMFNAKEFGFKSDEFLNAAFDINPELTKEA